jgi:predicted alpha/beta superfamily hydrolase
VGPVEVMHLNCNDLSSKWQLTSTNSSKTSQKESCSTNKNGRSASAMRYPIVFFKDDTESSSFEEY